MKQQPFTWPNKARLAFVLGIAFEAWDRSKPTTGRGLQRGSIPANAVCRRDYSTETFREFGAKVGLRRLLDICDRYDLKVSMPINGLTCEYYPELVKEAHQRGHEMIAHGWDQGEYLYMLTREQERDNIVKTVEAITRLTGERPLGWSSPGVRSTDNTLELNVEAGLLYNCDYHDFFDKFKDEFDYRYEIGADNPTMMNVISHAYLSARIPVIDTFEQIIAYAKRHQDVWFARRGDIAAWARKYFEKKEAL